MGLSIELGGGRFKQGAAVCHQNRACFHGFQKDSKGVERSAKRPTYIMQCW